MGAQPDLIDNLDGNTMAAALRLLLQRSGSADPIPMGEARIATAYFTPEGFSRIAQAIHTIPSIRLMLGADPISDGDRWQRKLDETEDRFIARKLRENLKRQEDALRAERDHVPFTKETTSALRQLVEALRAGGMEVRRYEASFLHAKAYIFTPVETDDTAKSTAVIVGSSNLTAAGLSSNLELNLRRDDTSTVASAKSWFDRLWEEAIPFDLASFFEEIFEPRTPFEIFLRTLWELYGDEIELDAKTDKGLPLTSFQKHGLVRALRLIRKTGGVIVADEVGLGKTFIAGDILTHYHERRQRALLVCPAALRDTTWKHFIAEHQLYLEMVSFEELGRDEQLWDENRRPNATGKHLARPIGEYQLVIVDEAHNYRNPGSPTRADALRALLYGKPKDVLMLTATPVNNSLWDLYHLIQFFIKQDSFLAEKGILSIKERFNLAMRIDPNSLSPDVLYPVIDATTVKRTRQFIKKHYPHDQIRLDGEMQTIVFPVPVAISVRYNLDSLLPGLFDQIEVLFDPENPECILFARYKADTYLHNPDPDDERVANAVTGLLLSGLLKRFESSCGAFRVSIERMIAQHELFLRALDEGYVVSTEFLKEVAGAGIDDDDFNDLLKASEERVEATLYDCERLREDVESDLNKLRTVFGLLAEITPDSDPKLAALISQLEAIVAEAENQALSPEDEINKRKVLIFSFFADTVRWVHNYLAREIHHNQKLSAYKGRFEMVVGSGHGEDSSIGKAQAAARFAPETAGNHGGGESDILISTDVLAEGVNLQQARHIINYDMPWNPMRLVQRHGRIDRIGSRHNRVFLRTIFPTDRLDALLGLEERIARKIAMAAASVGVVSPIAEVRGASRVFAETREEIQRLHDEDPSLYERGGTVVGAQSGEEYRQTLRKAIETRRDEIVQMPWKAGSGMRKGKEQGVFFCAKVGERTYLRFVHTEEDWCVKVAQPEDGETDRDGASSFVESEIGPCLRFIECSEEDETVIDKPAQDAAYDLWLVARSDIYRHWMHLSDPANLLPKVRPLNRKVAKFIRDNLPIDLDDEKLKRALDIVEAPWPHRDERQLREWFNVERAEGQKSRYLIEQILASGREPFIAPDPLPPIKEDDIELLVWMAITPV